MIHPSPYRPTIVGALIGAVLVTVAILALTARADALPDAGPSLDRAALIVSTPPVDAGPVDAGPVASPTVEPRTVDEGIGLARWVWGEFRAGRVAPALTVLLQALGLLAIARWTWVSARLPRLVRGKALAAVSSLTGTLAGLVPLAVAGSPVGGPLALALITAVGVFLLPGPKEVAGQTVPGAVAS